MTGCLHHVTARAKAESHTWGVIVLIALASGPSNQTREGGAFFRRVLWGSQQVPGPRTGPLSGYLPSRNLWLQLQAETRTDVRYAPIATKFRSATECRDVPATDTLGR